MKTTVKLEGMQFYAFHGYYKAEQKMGNYFVVQVEVEVKSFDDFDDRIEDTVNYEKIFNICKEEMAQTQQLLETVAFKILKRIQSLNHVTAGTISISKKNPPLGGDVDCATIDMSF